MLMWMPDDSAQPSFARGNTQSVAGAVERPPHQQMPPQGGVLSPRPQPVTAFRIRTDAGQSLNCRFDGVLSGVIDVGDRVQVSGRLIGGVFHASQIADEHGAVIGRTSACFVVTALCGDPSAPEVRLLRAFRDRVLVQSVGGRAFVTLYSRAGPPLAARLRASPSACRAIRRWLLAPTCRLLCAALPHLRPAEAGEAVGGSARASIVPTDVVGGTRACEEGKEIPQ